MTVEWLKDCEENNNKSDFYHWGIVLKDGNRLIGTIGAFINNDEPEYYEPGLLYWETILGKWMCNRSIKSHNGLLDK